AERLRAAGRGRGSLSRRDEDGRRRPAPRLPRRPDVRAHGDVVIRLDSVRRRPEKPVRVLLNGREVSGVVSLAALWNGGPGTVEVMMRVDGLLVVDKMRDRVTTHNRFGLVRVEVLSCPSSNPSSRPVPTRPTRPSSGRSTPPCASPTATATA